MPHSEVNHAKIRHYGSLFLIQMATNKSLNNFGPSFIGSAQGTMLQRGVTVTAVPEERFGVPSEPRWASKGT